MAKRSFSPVLWILLALMLRANLQAAVPASNAAPTSNNTTSNPFTTIPASRWKAPRRLATSQATTLQTLTPDKSSSIGYAISGETYQNETDSDASATRPVMRRRGSQLSGAASRDNGNQDYDAQLQPEFAVEQAGYEDVAPAESDGMEAADPASGYPDEMYPEEYWGEEDGYPHDPETPTSRFFHWLGTFKAERGYLFRSSHNSPRHLGIGQPLGGTSWLNRPSSISFFAGILNGDTLINNRVQQGSGLFGGLRLGWDFDHYWGVEARGGWSSPAIEYTGAPPKRVDGIFLCDADILYYPWGDAACRPYTLFGMGMARFNFTDDVGVMHDEYLLGIPFGLGFKYMYHPNLTFRAELLDNTAWGSKGLNNMNNLSFTLGMEFRFGGKPRSYYPWQPAKYIW